MDFLRENARFSLKWGISEEKTHDFLVKCWILEEKMLGFLVKWGICEEKTRDFRLNEGFEKTPDFRVKWGILEEKMRDFLVKWGISEEKTHAFLVQCWILEIGRAHV